MILYKYLPPKRIDILLSGLICFSDPKGFNDPFEVSPVFPPDNPEAVLLHKILSSIRADAKFREKLKDMERTLEKPFLEAGFVLSEASEQEIQARIEKLQDDHGMKRVVYENSTNVIGVLSLSAVPDSILMWSHYTAEHTGFVIGFDTAHPAWLKMQEDRSVGSPIEVTYSDKRPSPWSMDAVTPDDIWYTKSDVWSYEKEWRITRFIGFHWRRAQLGQTHPLYPFPKEAIAKIIVGCRASESLDFQINQLRVDVPEYKNYEVLRAEPDERHFKINLVPD